MSFSILHLLSLEKESQSQWIQELKNGQHSIDVLQNFVKITMGGALHMIVPLHVRAKFATPTLYPIDNLKIMIFFIHIHTH